MSDLATKKQITIGDREFEISVFSVHLQIKVLSHFMTSMRSDLSMHLVPILVLSTVYHHHGLLAIWNLVIDQFDHSFDFYGPSVESPQVNQFLPFPMNTLHA